MKYVTDCGKKVNTTDLQKEFDNIIKHAEKSNRGTIAAGRRFRNNTITLEKDLIEVRKACKRGNDDIEWKRFAEKHPKEAAMINIEAGEDAESFVKLKLRNGNR